MKQRELLKSKEYFELAIANRLRHINELKKDIRTDNPNVFWAEVYSQLFESQMSLFYLNYSIGEVINDFKNIANEVVENYITMECHPDFDSEKFSDYISVYEDGLRVTCLALLYDMDDSILHKLKQIFDEKKGKDALIENLLSSRIKIGKPSKKLIYPKLYTSIVELFGASEVNQIQIINNYLASWYSSMKSTSWYNSHKHKNVDSSTAFDGYWAIEVAAIVYALKIDDSTFRDLNYYPHELNIK